MELILKSPKYGEKIVLFDDEDYNLINNYKWYINFVRGKFYVISVKRKNNVVSQYKIHRVILGVTNSNIKIDHINNDGLDNRKINLRIATVAENSRNVGANKTSTTGYKGVYLYKNNNKNRGKYTATLRYNSKKIFGGYFATAELAALKYNELSLKYHGNFAYLNIIPNE
jgi:hypothetical protein